jgi:hypothetical protein
MKSLSAAMTKLAYFAYNFNSGFIGEVWGVGSIGLHLRDKFAKCHEQKGPTAGFWDFYVDLSQDNKDKLNDYVLSNYKGMASLDAVLAATVNPITGDDFETIKMALEYTGNALSENHKAVVRYMSPDVADAIWKDAMSYTNLKEKLSDTDPDDAGKDLAQALIGLMHAEGGEPGDTLVGKEAWDNARMVLKFHGYE